MSSLWQRGMHWLGLGLEDDYEDYDEYGTYDDAQRERPTDDRYRAAEGGTPPTSGVVRTLPPQEDTRTTPSPPIPTVDPMASTSRLSSSVRPLPATAATKKPHTVTPSSFDEAQDVADHFKSNQPVIINLQGAERDLRRRLIDFASGVCYALGGHMERVANHVYLLTPADVEVADEDRRLDS